MSTYWIKCGICGQIYDGGKVEVVARYADCTVWISPCCNQQVDDRQYVGHVTAKPITEQEKQRLEMNRFGYDKRGGRYDFEPFPGETIEEFMDRTRYSKKHGRK